MAAMTDEVVEVIVISDNEEDPPSSDALIHPGDTLIHPLAMAQPSQDAEQSSTEEEDDEPLLLPRCFICSTRREVNNRVYGRSLCDRCFNYQGLVVEEDTPCIYCRHCGQTTSIHWYSYDFGHNIGDTVPLCTLCHCPRHVARCLTRLN